MAPEREVSPEENKFIQEMLSIGAVMWKREPDEKHPERLTTAVLAWSNKQPTLDQLRLRVEWLKRNPQPKE